MSAGFFRVKEPNFLDFQVRIKELGLSSSRFAEPVLCRAISRKIVNRRIHMEMNFSIDNLSENQI
jgi:hypothetical protein